MQDVCCVGFVFMVRMTWGKKLHEMLARGQPLKQFMVGVVNVPNDPVCPGPAPSSVDVLEAVQCCPGGGFRALDHSYPESSNNCTRQ